MNSVEETTLIDRTSWKRIWSLAWPHSIENILFTLLLLVDLFWVGTWGGDDPLSAVTITGPIIWSIQSLSMFIFFGMLSNITRYIGSNEKERAALFGEQGVILALISGVLISAAGIFASPYLLKLYGAQSSVSIMAEGYLSIVLGGIPFFFLYMAFYAIFSSNNNTKDPMYLSFIAWLVNFILDPILIFGFWIIPPMGIEGAALATVISYIIAFLGFAFFLRHKAMKYIHIGKNLLKINFSVFKEIIRIGVPAGINGISRPLSATVIMGIITLYSVDVIAAFGIGVRIISINWIYLGGLNIAVSTLVGQNLGAQNIAGAKEVVKKILSVAIVIQLIISSAMIIFSNEIVSLFSSSSGTIKESVFFLRLLALGTLADVLIAVCGGALNGAGDTKRAMSSSLIGNWVFKIPAAMIVYYYIDSAAMWQYVIVVISLPVEGLINLFWYIKGSWTKVKIGLTT